MTGTDVIEVLRGKLATPVGRHLYGVLGSYRTLTAFSELLQQAGMPDGQPFAAPLSVNRGILDEIPDDEFQHLLKDEVIYPEPTRAHVAQAFERFLRSHVLNQGFVALANLEMLFAYHLELHQLRVMATDQDRILLLLPGKREGGVVRMFPGLDEGSYVLPTNLIADNHLWQLDE
jgi:hypothetical protein